MRVALLIGWKDCLVRFRSKMVLLFVIVLPLVMTYVIGKAFQGFGGQTVNASVAVVKLSQDDKLPAAFGNLESYVKSQPADEPDPKESKDKESEDKASATLSVIEDTLTEKEARERVADGNLDGVIIVPAGFAKKHAAGEPAELQLVVHANRTLPGSVVEIAFSRLVEILRQGEKPAADVTPRLSTTGTREAMTGYNAMAQAIAGNGMMFILLNCMTAGGVALVRERRQHTLARMLISPAPRSMVLLGKTLGVFYVGIAQAVVVFGFGVVTKNVPLAAIPGVVLVTVLVVLLGCAIGLTISSLCSREETAESVGIPIALVLTVMGGGMFPISDSSPGWMLVMTKVLPTGWAMDAYQGLLWRGQGFADIWLHLLIIAGFAAAFFAYGVSKLTWE